MTVLQKLGQISANLETQTRAREFAQYAAALGLARGDPEAALRYAETRGLPSRVRAGLKAAVPGATTTSASALASFQLAQGFSATLANVSVFDAILADCVQVPLRSVFGVVVSDASAAAVAEGAAKPLARLSVNSTSLQERKAAANCVVSEDVLRFAAGAQTLLENSMRTGVAAATDAIFIAAMLALTTPLASGGNVFQDLRRATDAAGSGGTSKFHLVVAPAVARHLALASTTTGTVQFPDMTVTGGALPGGIVVHVSDLLVATTVLLIDASALAASADAVSVRISTDTAVEMDSAPSASIAPVATNTVSMFQTNSVVIKVERFFGFSLLRASAVKSLSGVQWCLVGSPPA